MKLEKILKKCKVELIELMPQYEVVLFGSQSDNSANAHSDIDIAIISRNTNYYVQDEESKKLNMDLQKELWGKFPSIYDIKVFELYPIHIQISIINNYKVIFGDILEISEYFYQYRKRWEDCKYRIMSNQFKNYKERLNLLTK